ncbi:sugar kinase [Rhodovulum viride]|uniref:Sugar kinase n=1 Tax=Rhodovulum viride TaxID=1231134 RepID=A0ABX9DF24_9RHOB|nr:sugar kinase [Rhodovulum viride]
METPVNKLALLQRPMVRGTNQSGMRAHNERLVLTILRRTGPLPKAQIARMTGLSAQTVSVIMRALEADGLLVRNAPVRGKVGQPSVPIGLAADGAFFFGLKVGRRSLQLVLTDFLGDVLARVGARHAYPTPDSVLRFALAGMEEIMGQVPQSHADRISGLGIAIPFRMWDWIQSIGAPRADMDAWRVRDLRSELAERVDFPVYLQNDASAACGAELVLGSAEVPPDFVHFFIGSFIGGGIVLNGSLFTGNTGNAGALGSMPVLCDSRKCTQLIDVASLATLERMLAENNEDAEALWTSPDAWAIDEIILQEWILLAAQAIAVAIAATGSVLDIGAALIDGWMPASVRARLVEEVRVAFSRIDTTGIQPPVIMAGTVGPDARALGGACLAMSERFLVDQNALLAPL